MHILMISPIPSHPSNQGNSACITALGSALKLVGSRIHFVYVTLEGLTAPQANAMSSFWDSCSFVDASRSQRRQSRPDYWLLDDFYVDALDDEIERLVENYEFDACIVHYVWFSRALLNLPAYIPRIIYTHDRFGDRHLDFLRQGQAPAWFYTSIEEEAAGLARADHIVAIQEVEAEYFRSITDRRVHVFGTLLSRRFLKPAPIVAGRKLRVGFVGSANPTNVYSLAKLIETVRDRPNLLSAFEFVIGGSLSSAEVPGSSFLTKLGFVDDLDDFYGSLDIAINPNLGGSGLKIKSVEALSYGLPLLATADAMLGLPVRIPEHQCATVDELADHLQHIAFTPSLLDELRRESHHLFRCYQANQWNALLDLHSVMGRTRGAEIC